MKKWVRSGLVWGGILYVFCMIALPLIDGERLSYFKLLLGIPLWIVTGLAIGYLFDKKKKSKKLS